MRYVIIGNSAAGNAAAGAILAGDPGGEVVILSDETHQAYYRPLITHVIEETFDRKLLYRDEEGQAPGVDRRLGKRVERIDPAGHRVYPEGGDPLSYDRLLLATGSSSFRLPIPGMEGEGVYGLRTLDDAVSILRAAEGVDRAVVIGAGRVGMKAAAALRFRGLEVTAVEKLDRVVPLQFDDAAGEILGSAVSRQGITLVFGGGVEAVLRENGAVKGVQLEGGRLLEAGLVVVAAGVAPNIALAENAGASVGRGILTDRFLETDLPDVYAAGDAAETRDLVTGEPIVSGMWTTAVEMGAVAGRNMAGERVEYDGALGVLNALELGGIPTISVGVTNPPEGEGYEVHARRRGESYRKLVLREGFLVGALLVGDIEGAGVYTGLIKRRAPVASRMDGLIRERPSYGPWFHGISPGGL